MQNTRNFSIRRGLVPPENQTRVNEFDNVSPASAFVGILPSAPKMPRSLHDVQFQPSEICPQNFVIVDETDYHSQIMFNPAIAQTLSYPHMDFHETSNRESTEEKHENNFGGNSSPLIEDSEYIDLLMSLDDQENSEEEEVSTARTQKHDGSSSPESCCNYASKSQKVTYPSSIKRSSAGGSSHSVKKRKEARKMVKALRGMVPGDDEMNTAAVFDAAVVYLKGLEDKVQNLGLSNLTHFP